MDGESTSLVAEAGSPVLSNQSASLSGSLEGQTDSLEGHAGAAVAFGNFDGVHVGHRTLIDQLRTVAAPRSLAIKVLTFDPHPRSVLQPDRAPLALDTLAGRVAWLQRIGVDHVEVATFDDALRVRSAEWFIDEMLLRRLGARLIIASDDSRFGAGGRGDIAMLKDRAAAVGVEVICCPAVLREGDVVSSSRIRRLVSAGEIAAANRLLGRPYALRGPVVHGAARGRTIGFPTANIAIRGQVTPANGVYVGRVDIDRESHDAVCNLGVRPTVDGKVYGVEAHILDWTGDLYGRQVSLHLLTRLRGEQRFAGLAELTTQIRQDCTQARSFLRTQ